jgi:hypothetical protein
MAQTRPTDVSASVMSIINTNEQFITLGRRLGSQVCDDAVSSFPTPRPTVMGCLKSSGNAVFVCLIGRQQKPSARRRRLHLVTV